MSDTSNVNKDFIKKWVQALRSGEYTQVRQRLMTSDIARDSPEEERSIDDEPVPGYCCLGVANQISGLGHWNDEDMYAVPLSEENYHRWVQTLLENSDLVGTYINYVENAEEENLIEEATDLLAHPREEWEAELEEEQLLHLFNNEEKIRKHFIGKKIWVEQEFLHPEVAVLIGVEETDLRTFLPMSDKLCAYDKYRLSSLNDDRGWDFKRIADAIEHTFLQEEKPDDA